jgi:hypothetical protein
MTYAKTMLVTDIAVTSVTLPADFNPADNLIEGWGAGSGGAGSFTDGQGNYWSGAGGGAGAYAAQPNVALSPGSNLAISIGAGGIGSPPNVDGATDGGDTIIGDPTAPYVVAKGAARAHGGSVEGGFVAGAPGKGGQASQCVGSVTYSGGDGAASPGSAAGAAAGPNGDGSIGVVGGHADNGLGGENGGGPGAPGAPGTERTDTTTGITAGSGGGGARQAGPGGKLGGGGGGAKAGNDAGGNPGGSGAQGLVAISWNPA